MLNFLFQINFLISKKYVEELLTIFLFFSFISENKKGVANIKNQKLTRIAIALIFCEFSFDNPKGKLSVSKNNLILINNIIMPPIYQKAKPKPEDLPKFLLSDIFFNREL